MNDLVDRLQNMNKRLQELANQAGFVYIKDEGIGWAGQYKSSLPLFALLIVKECDSIIEKYSKANMESDNCVAMLTMMQKEIKEHFGTKS
jgi:hypothetical protein